MMESTQETLDQLFQATHPDRQVDKPAQAVDAQRLLEMQAQRIATLQEEIRQRQEEVDALKRQILETREIGAYKAGNLTVKVQKGRKTLDVDRFKAKYPVKDWAVLYEVKPLSLSKIVRQVGEPAVEDCVKTGAGTVTVS